MLGPDAAKAFYRGLKANDVQVVPGNKQTATGVSEGQFAVGLTDTDDALIELNAGKPVAIIFPDRDGHPGHPRMGVLYIPNTVAVVKGCPNPAGAKKLVDYLLRPETEAKLAEGGGFQIPLNPKVKANLPPALLTPDAGEGDGGGLREGGRPVGRGAGVPARRVCTVSLWEFLLQRGWGTSVDAWARVCVADPTDYYP